MNQMKNLFLATALVAFTSGTRLETYLSAEGNSCDNDRDICMLGCSSNCQSVCSEVYWGCVRD